MTIIATFLIHVLQKIDDRIHSAISKNAALDPDHFQALSHKLEYSDLRELQDTMISKQLWFRFEPRFASKGTLDAKFSQLADLRNGIRHSRTVSEIARMKGEAAILWLSKS